MSRKTGGLTCFVCSREILLGEGRMLGLDRPYVNLWFHRGCYPKLDNEGWYDYLVDNKENLAEYINNTK